MRDACSARRRRAAAAAATTSSLSDRAFFAVLKGSNETSGGDRNGKGSASVTFDGTRLCWGITVANLSTPVGAHIHKARRGKDGSIVVPLEQPTSGDPGASSGCTTVTAALARAIRRQAGQLLRQRPLGPVPGRSDPRAAVRRATEPRARGRRGSVGRHGGDRPLRAAGLGQDHALPRPLARDPRADLDGPAAHPRARGGAAGAVPRDAAAVRRRQHEPDRRPTGRATSAPAREAGFKVVGYLVEVDPARRCGRNARRAGRAGSPTAACSARRRRLVRPTPEEGFDELWHATAGARRRLADRAAGSPHRRCSERAAIAVERGVDRVDHVASGASRRPPRRSRAPARAAWRRRSRA